MAAPYCPDDYSSAIAASNVDVADPRWATETDCQYFYPGFEPNHLLIKQKKEQQRKMRRFYDPSAYAVSSSARQQDTQPPLTHHLATTPPPPPPPPQEAAPPPPQPIIAQPQPQTYYANPDPSSHPTASSLRPPQDLSSIHSEVLAPARRRPTPKGKRSSRSRSEGRSAADSSFTRPFHAYGWKNTKPSVDGQYMKTHNVLPPKRQVYEHVATRRSRSITYKPEEAEVADQEVLLRGPIQQQQMVPQQVAPQGEGVKEVLLDEGRIKLVVRPSDDPAQLDASVRRCLGVPPGQPLHLVDSLGRPAVLSYHTVNSGERLAVAPQEAGHGAGSLARAMNDLKIAGRPTTARVSDSLRRY